MSTKPQDARHVPLSDVDKLRQDAVRAAELRALHTDPDVVALRTEKVRSQVDGLMWAGLLLGLAFTMVNVQTFAAAGAAVGSLAWLAAWLLDPMVSLVLVAVLRAEQITARYQVPMRTDTIGPWVRRTKVFAFLATYTMNTWQSWAELHVAGIVLHSVPPVMVYLAAETGPILRDRLTEAVLRAAPTRHADPSHQAPADASVNASTDTSATTPTPTRERRVPRSRTPAAPKPARQGKPRRKFLADYVAEARAHLVPGVVPDPAWVRSVVPEIGRGTSKNVADALKAELAGPHANPTTNPAAAPAGETSVDQPEQGRAA